MDAKSLQLTERHQTSEDALALLVGRRARISERYDGLADALLRRHPADFERFAQVREGLPDLRRQGIEAQLIAEPLEGTEGDDS